MKIIAKVGTLTVLFMFAVGALWAGDVTGGATTTITTLFTYVADTPAKASEVNQNFALIRDAVNDNDTRISSLESGAFMLNQNETVTGIPSFNGGTSGSTPPYYVDSTYRVNNLNADYLDGYHASSFLLTAQKPAIATAVVGNVSISTYPDFTELESVSITTPGAGKVLVTGECFLNFYHTSGTASAFMIAVSDSPTTYHEWTYGGVPSSAGSGTYYFSCSASYVFTVSSAGTYTYYLVGRKSSSTASSGSSIRNRIVALFIPN